MTRSKSDLGSFAKELCTDSSLGSHVTQALERRSPCAALAGWCKSLPGGSAHLPR